MKPTTKFEHSVALANANISPIPTSAVEWAIKTLIAHPAFRTAHKHVTCGDCGHSFDFEGKPKTIKCPVCGAEIEVRDTTKRNYKLLTALSILDVVDGIQVQRVVFLNSTFKKGEPAKYSTDEVCRLWLTDNGQKAVTAKKRTMHSFYIDSFTDSEIELRKFSEDYTYIADTPIYPKVKFLPILKRNGLKGKYDYNCNPFRLMCGILADPRIETLIKRGMKKEAAFFIDTPSQWDKWDSLKVAMRHGYKITDIKMWCEMVTLLNRLGKDCHSPKYLCPANLKAAHTSVTIQHDKMVERNRRALATKYEREDEINFFRMKSCYFGIFFGDADIDVSVLDTVKAYRAEAQAMHHCVFSARYFARPDSIILSARDKSGKRIETIEFSLIENKVIQSRGVCNTNTEYHEQIINLVNANAHRFQEVRTTA